MLGERATAVVADMQLQQFVIMRRISQRVTSALAVLHENIDILPGEELQAFVGGKLQGNNHHVGRDPFQLLNTARQRFDFDILYCPDLAALNDKFRQWHGAAKQSHPRLLLDFRKRTFVMAAEIDLSLYDFALASATRAVSAPIGK